VLLPEWVLCTATANEHDWESFVSLAFKLDILIYVFITVIAVELPNVAVLDSQLLLTSIESYKQD